MFASGLIRPLLYLARKAEASECSKEVQFRTYDLGLVPFNSFTSGLTLGRSGRGGTGIVVARTEKGWSGPSAIGTGGIGFGFQAGVQVSELVIVLNTPEAVNAFSKGGNVTLGGALSVAAGPVGRDAEGSLTLGAADPNRVH